MVRLPRDLPRVDRRRVRRALHSGVDGGLRVRTRCLTGSDSRSAVLWWALPQTRQIALGVGEVGGEAHLPDLLARADRCAAELLDLRQGRVDVVDIHGEDRPPEELGALHHAAADVARL